MNKKPSHNNEKGQLVIEFVLLMVLVLGAVTLIKKQFSEKQILSQMISGPWASVSFMMENGTWDKKKSPDEAHPQTSPISRAGDEK